MGNPEPIGYVDVVMHGVAVGWVSARFGKDQLVVEVDGQPAPAVIEIRAREDLISLDIDGFGFEARFDAPLVSYDVRIGVVEPDENAACHLRHSVTGDLVSRIEPFPSDHAIVSAAELNELAQAIDPDSEAYQRFLSRYVNVRGIISTKIDVLFVDGTGGSVSTRYRATNLAEGLQEQGYATRYVTVGPTPLSMIASINARVVVFFRAPLTDDFAYLLAAFRARSSRILYDMDDLIVDPSLISKIDGVRYLSAADTASYHEGMKLYRKFALAADLVTCSTPYLADYVGRLLDVKTAVIRNSIGRRYLRHYSADHGGSTRDPARFIIGYYSGSKTHQKDFAQAVEGVARFLKTYSSATLRIVGMLDMNEFAALAPLADRIEFVANMPYYRMIEDIGACDVVIAPLDTGDPFCESKSELKFFEAALRLRPCVASPTRTYREAMRDGEVGLLASNPEEWFSALETLYLSPAFSEQLAHRAFHDARTRYSYVQATNDAKAAYFGFGQTAGALPATKMPAEVAHTPDRDRLDIAVIIPGLVIGGGGHRKILRFCRDWAAKGHKITLYVETADHLEHVRRAINLYFFSFDFELLAFRGQVHDHEIYICTHWTTAYHMRLTKKPESVFYFIQDFEPMFSAVSSDYVKAMGTYQMGFNLVPFGHWVSDRIERETGIVPSRVDFTVDLQRYGTQPDVRRNIDILFFARPSQPRRCFELGVEVLRALHKANPATRIALYGEEQYGDLGFSYHNFGMVTDLDRLARVYNRTKVGVCFSTTNPSSVGYEMVACGANLVDLKVPGWEHNFGGDGFVHYALPTPENVVRAITDALGDEQDMEDRRRAGISFVSSMPDDTVLAEQFMDIILRKIS